MVLQENGIINYQCARSPSQLCIFSKLVGPDLIFVSFDTEHGAGRELLKLPIGYTNWNLSPDGSRLAIFPTGIGSGFFRQARGRRGMSS